MLIKKYKIERIMALQFFQVGSFFEAWNFIKFKEFQYKVFSGRCIKTDKKD
jgi:hypothetical protein